MSDKTLEWAIGQIDKLGGVMAQFETELHELKRARTQDPPGESSWASQSELAAVRDDLGTLRAHAHPGALCDDQSCEGCKAVRSAMADEDGARSNVARETESALLSEIDVALAEAGIDPAPLVDAVKARRAKHPSDPSAVKTEAGTLALKPGAEPAAHTVLRLVG